MASSELGRPERYSRGVAQARVLLDIRTCALGSLPMVPSALGPTSCGCIMRQCERANKCVWMGMGWGGWGVRECVCTRAHACKCYRQSWRDPCPGMAWAYRATFWGFIRLIYQRLSFLVTSKLLAASMKACQHCVQVLQGPLPLGSFSITCKTIGYAVKRCCRIQEPATQKGQ